MESGVFIAKETVSRFLLNYDDGFVNDTFADLYFTTYMNQIPYQLEGSGSYVRELTLIEKDHLVKSDGLYMNVIKLIICPIFVGFELDYFIQ
jgi:hypothetical protein